VNVDIRRFCEEAIDSTRQTTGAKQNIVFQNHGDLGEAMLDERLLEHVVGNLLSNAVKYSPAESTVLFSADRMNGELVLEVTDEGIGIAPEDQEQLFEAFHRGKNVGNVSGSGLGLAIVKKSLDVYGGSVAVRSEPGKGTSFVVRLPTGGNA